MSAYCLDCGILKTPENAYKHCTLGLQYYCKQCHKKRCKQNYWETKHLNQESSRIWREGSHESKRVQSRVYKAMHPKQENERRRRWRKAHPEEHKLRIRRQKSNQCKNLGNQYVKKIIKMEFGLKGSQIPDNLVQIKREQLMVHRALKQLTEVINE